MGEMEGIEIGEREEYKEGEEEARKTRKRRE
jgi:hypothetical protein